MTEYLQFDSSAKDETPKVVKAAWGKPQVQQTHAAPSLLEIEAEQKKEKERLEALMASKPGPYKVSPHGTSSFASATSSPGAYTRPERSDGPTTSFESYNRVPRQPGQIPTSPPYTAYVGNLPFNVVEEQLAEFFGGLSIKEIRLVKNSDGRSKGYAFIEFETVNDLRSSLTATDSLISGRKIIVEVQPPKAGGERTYATSTSTFDREEDKGRWGPSSGSGPASTLGSLAQNRSFESRPQRTEGSFGREPRDNRGFDDDNRQWRGKETYQSPVQHTSPTRPKIDLKPRTVTEEIGKIASEKQSSSEDPFGGALNPEKAKRQAEIQAQREAEASAKHKIITNGGGSKFGERDGPKRQEEPNAWRSNKTQQDDHHNNSNSNNNNEEKYRFNRGTHPHDQRAPQRNNEKSTTANPSSNTFESLASTNTNRKW